MLTQRPEAMLIGNVFDGVDLAIVFILVREFAAHNYNRILTANILKNAIFMVALAIAGLNAEKAENRV